MCIPTKDSMCFKGKWNATHAQEKERAYSEHRNVDTFWSVFMGFGMGPFY